MKKLTLGILLMAGVASYAQASTVNIISSNGDFAGNSAPQYDSISLLTNNEIARNLNDNDAATHLFGSTVNGATTASLTIAFQDTVINETGDDLAFYFMGGSNEINNMRICFTSNCNPTQSFEASFINNLGVAYGGTTYALSVVTIDLTSFGFTDNQVLNEFTIDLIANGTNRLTSIDSLNVSAVPVPAAIWLFLTGLGTLGLFKRRRK